MLDLRDPDCWSMYMFGDYAGYGAVEVVQNLLVDFREAAGYWRQQWVICEALVLRLSRNWFAPMGMIDDSDCFQATTILVEHMFLSMLSELESQGQMGPNSDVRNLGMIMGLYAMEAQTLRTDGFIDPVPEAEETRYHGEHFVPYLVTYARKHNITIHGPSELDDILAKAEEEAEEQDVKVPAHGRTGRTPWDWATALKNYERVYRTSSGRGSGRNIGGDGYDITTMTSKERARKSFAKKDPLTPDMLKGLREGLILQLA
ncbi:hypothetical protein BO71DRAFT_312568 [Aspergillus ellipticus CBS 707.79]|uniref:Uncharacterized protein n=1 Tax=Aspergillus ellipticus CBS 707.79 TaxID=1448320 RepID=A0A319DR31_9EURO|nr:hypothetical protein BO71DRAFT_312568 [Aspergillus ellipticus CBS 707.79]